MSRTGRTCAAGSPSWRWDRALVVGPRGGRFRRCDATGRAAPAPGPATTVDGPTPEQVHDELGPGAGGSAPRRDDRTPTDPGRLARYQTGVRNWGVSGRCRRGSGPAEDA